MASIIKNQQIVEDPYGPEVITPIETWLQNPTEIRAVLLPNTFEPDSLEPENSLEHRNSLPELLRLDLIAIEFPAFNDGRGYSLARILREAGFKGELRAVGDIRRDQLFYLARCGFNAFALTADQDLKAALNAFKDFSEPYQGAADEHLPVYRKGVIKL